MSHDHFLSSEYSPRYDISACSTDVFGRVLRARNHHYVVDGPIQNNCPGEAVTPAEVFLSRRRGVRRGVDPRHRAIRTRRSSEWP